MKKIETSDSFTNKSSETKTSKTRSGEVFSKMSDTQESEDLKKQLAELTKQLA